MFSEILLFKGISLRYLFCSPNLWDTVMAKTNRRVLIGIGSLFGVLVVLVAGLAVFISTLDHDKVKKYISATVGSATGRQLNINGDLTWDLGWISKVHASKIQFENAPWGKQPQMAEIGAIDIEVDVWQLIRHFRVVLPTITMIQPKIVLEKNPDGAPNWELRAASAADAVPERRGNFPAIQKLVIKDGFVSFDNPQSNTRMELNISQAEGAGFLDAPVNLKAQGAYQKLPFTLALDGGSYENLHSARQPYPLQIDLRAGKLKARITGNLTEPLAMKGEDVTLDIQGDDMANLYSLIRLVFPKTPPYRLKGRLKHEGDVWSFTSFSGRVGDSDLSGDIRVDTAPERPVMKADLVSNLLDLDDLAGFIGGNPGTGSSETASEEQKKQAAAQKDNERIFPDQRYDLERLNAMDADVQLRAKKILAPKLPIDDLNAKLTLNNGVLRFTPATFGVANGRLEIFSTFDGSQQPSKVKIDARMRQLDLRRFLGESSFAQKTLSPISGRIVLSGAGQSFRELMASASGNTFLAMSGGEISGMVIELAGLDVAESLGYLVRGDKSIPVRCGVLDLRGENGQMAVKTLVFDTEDTIISGEGNVDLRDEKVNLIVLPVPKDFSPLSLRSYIRARGPFKDISVFPDPIKIGTDSLVKKIFNALMLLITMPFQPRDLAQGKDIDCNALIAKIQDQDPQGIVLKDVHKSASAKSQSDQDNRAAQQHASRKQREPRR
jgi:hypothetical protein